MRKADLRIQWNGDVADGGQHDGEINGVRVCTIRDTEPHFESSGKPYALDHAWGLHPETAFFDTVRDAQDAAEGLLTDFLVAIDADWLPEGERRIAQASREVGEELRERFPDSEAGALLERAAHRYVQNRAQASGPIADPAPQEFSPPAHPSADYPSVWWELTGYVQQARNDGTQIDPAELLTYLTELKHRALAPIKAWMDSLKAPPPTTPGQEQP